MLYAVIELGLGASVSPFVAALTRKLAVAHPDLALKHVKCINAQFVKKPNSFGSMLQDAVGSRFVEAFLFAATGDTLKHYLDEFLVPNCVAYARHVYANYPIQTLIKFKIDTEPQVRPNIDFNINYFIGLIKQVEKFNLDFKLNQVKRIMELKCSHIRIYQVKPYKTRYILNQLDEIYKTTPNLTIVV